MDQSDIEQRLDELAEAHPSANIPHEPYKGVLSLFNGDLYSVVPIESSRHKWFVESSVKIVYIPSSD